MTNESFEPPLSEQLPAELRVPASVRAATLAAVGHARRRRAWRRVGTGAVAAGLLLLVATSLTPRVKQAGPMPGGASMLLASERAAPAFAALDLAERELRTALAESAGDPELDTALASVRDQRARLQRMIREAVS